MTECIHCGGPAVFLDITGTVIRPTGAVYGCTECGRDFTIVDSSKSVVPRE